MRGRCALAPDPLPLSEIWSLIQAEVHLVNMAFRKRTDKPN